MKLNEIKHGPKDPIGMVLIRQLMAKNVPVFWQDMGEIVQIGWSPADGIRRERDEIFVRYKESEGRSHFDYLTPEQFEAMNLERVPGSAIEEWRLV